MKSQFTFIGLFVGLMVVTFLIFPQSFKPQRDFQQEEKETSSFDSTGKMFFNNLSLVGDFNGDGTSDTIWHRNFIQATGEFVDAFPDSIGDYAQLYFDSLNVVGMISCSIPGSDTIKLLPGELFCLINLGDLNNDRKDEIAFSVNCFDFSNVNSCEIYSICNGKWTQLESFTIFEDAFNDETHSSSTKRITQIDGYLEKRNNQWCYIDYNEMMNADAEESIGFKPLRVKSCSSSKYDSAKTAE